jgi:thiosulfate/3-mercaptopyruvate sulfurtransferase
MTHSRYMPRRPGRDPLTGRGPLTDRGPLISVADLVRLVGSADPPALLDVRFRIIGPPGLDSYLAGHLPGARFVDLDKDLAGRPGSGAGGRHPLPDAATFEAAMRAAGLGDGQLAVAYDDRDATSAARLWWLLRYFGHDQVAVLDGGLAAWTAAGHPVTAAVPPAEPGDFTAGPGGGMPVLDEAGAGELARSGFLLDARVAERYRGEIEPIDPVAGHIPGAINAPAHQNVTSDGGFLPGATLARRFAALGLPRPGEPAARADGSPLIGAYCGSGVTATQEILALELAGLSAALYAGSWSSWSADPARPVATGPDPG